MDAIPYGLHAVVPASEDCPPGVVFVLKNLNNSVNIDMQNRLHLPYISTRESSKRKKGILYSTPGS